MHNASGLKVYIAARYGMRAEMQDVARYLTSIGIIITSRWINGNHESVGGDSFHENTRFATEDIEDLLASDACVSFTGSGNAIEKARGWRHVEFGYALALNKRCVLVGPRENVFHFLPSVEWYANCLSFYQHWVAGNYGGDNGKIGVLFQCGSCGFKHVLSLHNCSEAEEKSKKLCVCGTEMTSVHSDKAA